MITRKPLTHTQIAAAIRLRLMNIPPRSVEAQTLRAVLDMIERRNATLAPAGSDTSEAESDLERARRRR